MTSGAPWCSCPRWHSCLRYSGSEDAAGTEIFSTKARSGQGEGGPNEPTSDIEHSFVSLKGKMAAHANKVTQNEKETARAAIIRNWSWMSRATFALPRGNAKVALLIHSWIDS